MRDAIEGVVTHNISIAVMTPDGEIDSRDGSLWRKMGDRWYVRSQEHPQPSPVTVPSTVAALEARQGEQDEQEVC